MLAEKEIPRGSVVTCRIYAMNIGNAITPKSDTTRVAFEGGGQYETTFANFEIPSLEPNKKTFIKQIQFTPHDNGVGWLVITINPVNNESFSYYHTGSYTERTNEWRNLYYVVDKQILEIISLLKTSNMLTKMKKKKKKKSRRSS